MVLDKFYLSLNMNLIYLYPKSGKEPTCFFCQRDTVNGMLFVKFFEILRECLRVNTKHNPIENIAESISRGEC